MALRHDGAPGWSRALFGTAHMLSVADAVARGPREFCARDVEEATRLAPSTVHRLLNRFADTGLLVRLPRETGDRHQRFRRVAHAFWRAAKDLNAQAIEVQV